MEPSLCNGRRDIRKLPQAFTSKPSASFPPWDAWESFILPWVHLCWEPIFVSPVTGGQFTVSNRGKWFVSSGRRPSYVSIWTLWTCVLCLLQTLDLPLLTTGFPSPRSVPPVGPQQGQETQKQGGRGDSWMQWIKAQALEKDNPGKKSQLLSRSWARGFNSVSLPFLILKTEIWLSASHVGASFTQ